MMIDFSTSYSATFNDISSNFCLVVNTDKCFLKILAMVITNNRYYNIVQGFIVYNGILIAAYLDELQ